MKLVIYHETTLSPFVYCYSFLFPLIHDVLALPTLHLFHVIKSLHDYQIIHYMLGMDIKFSPK